MLNKKKIQVFLSYSRDDKKIADRLGSDLSSHGIDIWIDDKNISLGESILSGIQEGLNSSDYLLLLLTPKAIASQWVKTEWLTKFSKQVQSGSIQVIPLMMEDCELPLFLLDRKYADFRKSYEDGLSTLLSCLNEVKIVTTTAVGNVYDYTVDLLEDLKGEFISLPSYRRLCIINILKKLPRSGKKVRLESFKPKVPIRSIYDHILSIAHSADCLMPTFNHGLPEEETSELARCIAYHELNEVILGDIPVYTSLSLKERKTARILAEERLRTVLPNERERIANEFIWMYLSDQNRASMMQYIEMKKNASQNIYLFFHLLDKIDPIIAVWRYLFYFRGRLEGGGSKVFLRKLKHFFENPEVKKIVNNFGKDDRILQLVTLMQDRSRAIQYYESRDEFYKNENLFGVPLQVFKKLIEGRELIFVEQGQI